MKNLAISFFFFLTIFGTQVQGSNIWLGIDVLEKELNFKPLFGKRVGILTHNAAVNISGKRTLDVLCQAKDVKVAAIFCPEHGLDGKTVAGANIENSRDKKTKLPIFSLHGKYRSPTPEMLKLIDVLVIDLQDIGVRSYTYVSCMRYAVEACFRSNIEVIVLDRPNPLGGLNVSGPLIDRNQQSYVGAFLVPYVHGLTIGELSRMIIDDTTGHPELPHMTPQQRKNGRLRIITMKGWRRSMLWHQTGLKWVKTSPNIPTLAAVAGYAITGIGCLKGAIKNGVGTDYPFRLLFCNGNELQRLYTKLCSYKIPGIEFQWIESRRVKGIYLNITNWSICNPGEVVLHLLQLNAWISQDKQLYAAIGSSSESLNNHILGENELIQALAQKGSQLNVSYFVKKWQKEVAKFKQYSRRYWLY